MQGLDPLTHIIFHRSVVQHFEDALKLTRPAETRKVKFQ